MKFNALIPELSVSNIETSLDFYITVLGFAIEYERKQDKFAFLSYGKAQIMLEEINGNWNVAPLEPPFGRGINFQIQTNNVQEISEKLKQNNIQPFKEIFESTYKNHDHTYIEKEILVQDPDGYLLRFSETIVEK